MSDRLLDAQALADFLGVDRRAVYASTRLRSIARRIDLDETPSKRPRLRWHVDDVLDLYPTNASCEGRTNGAGAEPAPTPEPARRPPGRPRRVPAVPETTDERTTR